MNATKNPKTMPKARAMAVVRASLGETGVWSGLANATTFRLACPVTRVTAFTRVVERESLSCAESVAEAALTVNVIRLVPDSGAAVTSFVRVEIEGAPGTACTASDSTLGLVASAA